MHIIPFFVDLMLTLSRTAHGVPRVCRSCGAKAIAYTSLQHSRDIVTSRTGGDDPLVAACLECYGEMRYAEAADEPPTPKSHDLFGWQGGCALITWWYNPRKPERGRTNPSRPLVGSGLLQTPPFYPNLQNFHTADYARNTEILR